MTEPKIQNWRPAVYRSEDRQAILSLIHSYYGPIETANDAFFEWQYFKNPSGNVILWLAHSLSDDALVGQHVLLPMRFHVDQVETKSALSFNALVDPRYHGQGIWTGLGRKAHDDAVDRGTAMTYGIPNPNSHRPMVKELEYKAVFDVPVLVKPLNLGQAVRTVMPGIAGNLAAPAADFIRPLVFPKAKAPAGGGNVAPVDRFDSGFDLLAGRAATRYRVLLLRDAAHLNWRYVDCPTRTCRRWAVRDGDRVDGYAVLRVTDFRGLRMGVLLDFLTDGSETGRLAGLSLAAIAEETARAEGCSLLLGFCLAHTTEFSLLIRSGWKVGPKRFLPQPFPLLVRPLSWGADRPGLDHPENWFLSTGDYDVF